LWLAREKTYDAIVLDVMLPKLNGYRVCRALRAERDWTPILMLTAKEGEWDEIEGLDTGADDYLTEPVSYAVLLARLRALLRREARERPVVLAAGDLRLDPASRTVSRAGRDIEAAAGTAGLREAREAADRKDMTVAGQLAPSLVEGIAEVTR
jgi:DNA-binding response OmpR family regulator